LLQPFSVVKRLSIDVTILEDGLLYFKKSVYNKLAESEKLNYSFMK